MKRIFTYERVWWACMIASVLALMTYLLGDICGGSPDVAEGTVTGKQYIPERVEHYTTTDEDGEVEHHTRTYPEQWMVYVNWHGREEFNTTCDMFHSVTNGQRVVIGYRVGRWSGISWGCRIVTANVNTEN